MRKNVLITSIGSFAADIVIKELKKMHYNVIGCDIYPREWIAQSCDVDLFYQAPRALEEKKYINFLIQLIKEYQLEIIIPLTDVEVDILDKHRSEFTSRGVLVTINSHKILQIVRRKDKLADFIKEIKIVETIPYEKLVIEQIEKFPIVLKPVNGRSSQGIYVINNKKEYDFVISKINKVLDIYIMQPFIEGNIITTDVVRDIHGNCVVVARKENLRTSNGAGLSVEVFGNEELENKCIEISNMLGIIGCVNYEWIYGKDGKYYFLECNPRFSGGVAFTCKSGYNMVRNHINAFKSEKIEQKGEIYYTYYARKYMEVAL